MMMTMKLWRIIRDPSGLCDLCVSDSAVVLSHLSHTPSSKVRLTYIEENGGLDRGRWDWDTEEHTMGQIGIIKTRKLNSIPSK